MDGELSPKAGVVREKDAASAVNMILRFLAGTTTHTATVRVSAT